MSRLGLGVRPGHAVKLEGEAVAGVGIGEDGRDLSDGLLYQRVDGHGAGHACVADIIEATTRRRRRL